MQVFGGVPGQQNPCLGQAVSYECLFQSGRSAIDFTVVEESGDTNTLTVLVARKIQTVQIGGAIFTANFTSDMSAQLDISSVTSMLNRSTVSCETVPATGSQSISIIVLGMDMVKFG